MPFQCIPMDTREHTLSDAMTSAPASNNGLIVDMVPDAAAEWRDVCPSCIPSQNIVSLWIHIWHLWMFHQCDVAFCYCQRGFVSFQITQSIHNLTMWDSSKQAYVDQFYTMPFYIFSTTAGFKSSRIPTDWRSTPAHHLMDVLAYDARVHVFSIFFKSLKAAIEYEECHHLS